MKHICATGVWRIFPLTFMYVVGIAMVAPQLPALLLDFMASRRAGMHLRCEDFHPHKQPSDCRDAYSDVVWWSTSTSFFTNSVLTFLMAPMVGTWSDVLGRRPFLLASMCLGSLPLAVLLCHLMLGSSLLFYYPASALGGAVSIISITLAYIADLLTPCYRATGFGALMASFSVGILIGPAIGSMLDPLAATYGACGCGLLCILYVYFLVPESLSPEAMLEAQRMQDSNQAKALGHTGGLRILFRSKLFKRLTVCLMVSGIVTDGLADLLIQYFKLLFNFSVQDVTLVFELFGVCGLLVQTVVLRYMLAWLGEARVLTVGLSAAMLEMLLVSFISAKWQAFGVVAIGSLGGMAFPAISSIKANNVADSEQGTIQGALYGAKALATGTGPLLFAAMFAGFTKTDSPLPYFPGAPFLLGTALMVVAIGYSLTIDSSAARGNNTAVAPGPSAGEGSDLEAPLMRHEHGHTPQHLADLPLPNQGYVAAEAVEALLLDNQREEAQVHGGGRCAPGRSSQQQGSGA